MKTTLDLPDDLMRAAKIRAATEGRRLKDVMAELVRRGLAEGLEDRGGVRHRVRLPLIECAHPAQGNEEMTPGRVSAILAQEDADAVHQAP